MALLFEGGKIVVDFRGHSIALASGQKTLEKGALEHVKCYQNTKKDYQKFAHFIFILFLCPHANDPRKGFRKDTIDCLWQGFELYFY